LFCASFAGRILECQRAFSHHNKNITLSPYIKFHGTARQALGLYMDVFPDAKIVHLKTFGEVPKG
jgi:predicted 3-demethylubiquinone-9 3-methyltransferase (glyoxalase superfamily)